MQSADPVIDLRQALLDRSSVGIFLTGPDRRILELSEKAARMFGYRREELIGQSFKLLHLSEAKAAEAATYFPKLMAEGFVSMDYPYRHKSGAELWCTVSGTPLDPERPERGTVWTLTDISERKRMEQALLRANELTEQAQQASRAKSQFLANMSHELRTPLNVILGMNELLAEEIHGTLAPEQKHSVKCVEESGRHLLSLINDILGLAKIEAGRTRLEIAEVELRGVCEESVRMVEAAGVLSFCVTDTGIGIPEEDLAKLFQPFVQVDNSMVKRYGGLALVRHFVEMHGGTVRVESELGAGSRFTVSFPWERGAEVVLASNGLLAVIEATRSLPDIILMDVQMPEMDGLEATRRLKADASTAHIPVVSLTAFAMEGDRDNCLAAGADGYVSKPINFAELFAVMAGLVG